MRSRLAITGILALIVALAFFAGCDRQADSQLTGPVATQEQVTGTAEKGGPDVEFYYVREHHLASPCMEYVTWSTGTVFTWQDKVHYGPFSWYLPYSVNANPGTSHTSEWFDVTMIPNQWYYRLESTPTGGGSAQLSEVYGPVSRKLCIGGIGPAQ